MALLRRSATALPLLVLSFLIRLIILCASAVTLGIFAYFLAVLSDHSLHINSWVRAVTGISGASTLYAIVACVFVFCCAGVAILSTLAILLDLAFTGAWIYIVYETRGATNGCASGTTVKTPIGTGVSGGDNTVSKGHNGVTVLPSLKTSCQLQEAVFGVGLVAIVFFLLALLVEFLLIRSHKKGKKYGPSPANNYTGGRAYGAGIFKRFKSTKGTKDIETAEKEKNPDALTAVHPEPELDYVAPNGTAVPDDTKAPRYGTNNGTSNIHGSGSAAYNNTSYSAVNGMSNEPYSVTNTMTTTTTTTTNPIIKHSYADNF